MVRPVLKTDPYLFVPSGLAHRRSIRAFADDSDRR
jgi:hypothetical protein